jgi:hypothetical protein
VSLCFAVCRKGDCAVAMLPPMLSGGGLGVTLVAV